MSPSKLVVKEAFSPPCQTSSVTNSSSLCSNKATFRVSSEEAFSPLPESDIYISSLSPKEYKAYLIAKSHLEMSFDVEKSIGFKQFMQTSPVTEGHLRS
jgi:hypothetical protein